MVSGTISPQPHSHVNPYLWSSSAGSFRASSWICSFSTRASSPGMGSNRASGGVYAIPPQDDPTTPEAHVQGPSAPNSDVPQTPTSPYGQQAESPPLAVRSGRSPSVELSVDNSVETVDEALIARLRQAIAVEEEGDDEQLNSVLRMLGAKAPDS
jgi:hypothetical protein